MKPKTCKEAAQTLDDYRDTVSTDEEWNVLKGQIEILEAFGEVPLPKVVEDNFQWDYIFLVIQERKTRLMK